MKIQPHLLRMDTLFVVSVVLIIMAATNSSVCAATPNAESDPERHVLEQLHEGEPANLNEFPNEKRGLSATFIAKLLTSRDLKIYPRGIFITDVLITGRLDLEDQEILHEVTLIRCTFEKDVIFRGSNFAKNLDLSECNFGSSVDFSSVTVGGRFMAAACSFKSPVARFDDMRVGRDLDMAGVTFDSGYISFTNVRVDGTFFIADSEFNSDAVYLVDMRITGRFAAERCAFNHTKSLDPDGATSPEVAFEGSHFSDMLLDGATFNGFTLIDFSRLEADFISFDRVSSKTPTRVNLQGMAFKLMTPVKADQLQFLLSRYDAGFYSNLEYSLRIHGYPEEADHVYILKRRAERRENCKSFLDQCDHAGPWILSIFEDALAGYGKSLQNLLYWSLGFFFLGVFVFRSEKGMKTRDGKEAENYEGKYNPFWYSLDLFLPIIKLGEADVWTPKDYRRWANLYRKVHIIIGSLFVPIGLAAWTGIIK